MNKLPYLCLGFLFVSAVMLLARVTSSADAPPKSLRDRALREFRDGNYNDSYELLRQITLNPKADAHTVGDDLSLATQCLQQLARIDEIDEYREDVIKIHADNWRLLWKAAINYMDVNHQGFIVAGKFRRGPKRGGGNKWVNSVERDRVRALQLLVQASRLAQDDPERDAVAQFHLSFADFLATSRGYGGAWRLQYLTNLDELPDYDEGWYHGGSRSGGAPVDVDGKPVYYDEPRTFAEAENDGQRWRWALAQAVEYSPRRINEVRLIRARFGWQQHGVQTMAYYGRFFARQTDEGDVDESGTYALHKLGENETIAKLATGIKRFELPDEHNFIKLFQTVAEEGENNRAREAVLQLGQIFENRRQYPRAADYYRQAIRRFRTGQDQLKQIEGSWGRFEPVMSQPRGRGATVDYRFRNGTAVSLTAHKIDVSQLLDDIKAYLKSNPQQLDWQKMNIGNLGYALVQGNAAKYVGRQVAAWDIKLSPRKNHFDRRITVTTPLQEPGAFVLTAEMQNGNVSKIIIWISDTAIVKKPLAGKTLYFLADAVTGAPVADAQLDFFGYRQRHLGGRKFQVDTRQFDARTGADGQLQTGPDRQPREFQWIITARAGAGRFAYLGFTGVWYQNYYDQQYEQSKVFVITDRPVYRPDQTVNFKFWVRHAKYDKDNASSFAGQTFPIEIYNAKGEKIHTQSYTADEFGGFSGELKLPADAALGVYRLQLRRRGPKPVYGNGSFRVEEYKKPEFEVTIDAPTEPVMLGEKITAELSARYYFGSPVTEAKVKYKVLRTSYSQSWYPVGRWDWLYGKGYWWFASDYPWYPGWRSWGCIAPHPWWWPMRHQPPEVVAEREVEIGPDGTLQIEIDTGPAKAIHGDQDHQYQITAEVVDMSRRTIVGTGTVKVARQPFKVFAWVNRGYYRVGDTIRANFSAHTLDNKPVQGDGHLRLLRISYDKDRQPVETVEQQWDLPTDAQGQASLQIKATRAGQYRLSYKVTDEKDHKIEGGYVFTIMGEGVDSTAFRFNTLELVTDRREYRHGETVNLMINTDRSDSVVLLFVRAANSTYLPPKLLRLKGKSAVQEIPVTRKDMPNFFIEAITVSDGRLHTVTKEIVVPPEKRVLDVAVLPSQKEYKPGERATVQVRLTDFSGEPVANASTVMTVYDKAVEYISGGSNVPEIRSFFWKWRRRHYPRTESNLGRYFSNLVLRGKVAMRDLGVFGGTVVEEGPGDDAEGRGANREFTSTRRQAHGQAGLAARAAPEAKAAMADGADMLAGAADKDTSGAAPAEPALVQPTIRSQFADTAFWIAALATDDNGVAQVEFDMPENLTAWKIKVWGVGHGTRVGEGEMEVVTRKNLIVRLQAPRFFVEKDEVVLSANVHNYLKTRKQVQVHLEIDDQLLEPFEPGPQTVMIDPDGEARVDWRVRVRGEGQTIVRVKALTDEESDAMQMSFPVYVHGMLKTESFSGALRPADNRGVVEFSVPAERRISQTRLEARYSPTLAGAMVDALPYLANYPYGCTEQTLNRFLPTVITQKVLIDMGLDLKAIQQKRTNLNAQEIGEDADRAKQWKRYQRNPVFDEEEVRAMVKSGIQRLAEMQLTDGGWGWFSGWGERSYPHTTAYVVHGLQIARDNDVALPQGMLDRGVQWLQRYQAEQLQRLKNFPTKTKPYKQYADNLDGFVYMVLVDADLPNHEMKEYLYRDRTHLAVYTKAMFALALHKQGDAERLEMLERNIAQFVVEDDENQTAYLKLPASDAWWYWYGSEYEAQAYYLKLLARTDPEGRLASRLVKYLLNNRKHSTYWNSTRDTALCIEAMAEFLKASGESRPDLVVEVWLDGVKQKEVEITADNLFTFDNRFVLTGDAVTTGQHRLEFRKRGTGPLYFNTYLTNFTLEDFITRAGLEIKVGRKYYQLTPVDKTIKAEGSRGQAVDQKVEKYEREEIENLATLKSGDLVEIELEIDGKNDYEYLIFEDMKPAGFEPVEVRSGYVRGGLGAYMELRDNRVVFFLRRLARGKHSVSYRMRAEIPGRFSALPTRAHAMYAPELKGNSDEIKLQVVD